jgi:multimeric flavodoxin WrbA/putative sterol carrier protein
MKIMNILVINGSPKGERSNTLKLANAFIENQPAEKITVTDKNIEPCRGCFCCWEKTPGRCVITDDVESILEKYNNAELVIWSFPLYCFGMPAKIKALVERLVMPNNLPDITIKDDGSARHLPRNDLVNQRHVLISTCGFSNIHNNYEALIKQFEIMFGGHYAKILCPQGELFRVPQLKDRTDEYLSCVKKAGQEYLSGGLISADTQKELSEPLFPPEQFVKMANASWERGTASEGETPDRASRLLRQMSVIYKPHGKDKDIVLEFNFTDLGKTYQLVMGKKNCTFKDSDLLPYTMRIETSFETWNAISEGRIDGKEALFQHKYSIKGDFSAVEYLDTCFSSKSVVTKKKSGQTKKRTMWLFILPWVAFWTAVPLFPDFGAYIALALTSAMPLFYSKYKPTVYDSLSVFFVALLSICVMLKYSLPVVVVLSYIIFGLLWLVSLFTRVPLCAWYSSNDWGEEAAFDNPLFILTNKIICAGWGILYLVSALWTWGLMNSNISPYTGLINSLAPILMGVFTAVFSKRFPAHYAQKNISR